MDSDKAKSIETKVMERVSTERLSASANGAAKSLVRRCDPPANTARAYYHARMNSRPKNRS